MDALESIEDLDNARLDVTCNVSVWGISTEATEKIEIDGDKGHCVMTMNNYGESEEYYYDGNIKYTNRYGSWVKESYDNSGKESFADWDIDSIKKVRRQNYSERIG